MSQHSPKMQLCGNFESLWEHSKKTRVLESQFLQNTELWMFVCLWRYMVLPYGCLYASVKIHGFDMCFSPLLMQLFLTTRIKLSDALNKHAHFVKLESTSFIGSERANLLYLGSRLKLKEKSPRTWHAAEPKLHPSTRKDFTACHWPYPRVTL